LGVSHHNAIMLCQAWDSRLGQNRSKSGGAMGMGVAAGIGMDRNILSRLRIVPTSAISTFEQVPDGGHGLVDPFGLDRGIVRHPFQVFPRPGSDHLLLTQADIFRALVKSGVQHVPVQECRPEEVTFSTSELGLSGFGRTELDKLLARNPEALRLADKGRAKVNGYLRLQFRFRDGGKVLVAVRNPVAHGCPLGLDLLFRSFAACGGYTQMPSVSSDSSGLVRVACYESTVSLPDIGLSDACAAADSDRLYPHLITRVSTVARILNIDVPISVLNSEAPLAQKEEFLREMVAMRIQARRTEYFQGPVYLLNW
jgi:hypothetical protein